MKKGALRSAELPVVGDMMAVAKLVRSARLAHGLTRDELASSTGLSPKFISHVEGGKVLAAL
jgi:DNA-binding XRE family transcriptional regulator